MHRPAAVARQLSQHPSDRRGVRDHRRRRSASWLPGFLSENAKFADILAAHNITFIGPSGDHIRIMGDKIEAKRTAKRLGIRSFRARMGRSPMKMKRAHRIRHRLSSHHQGLGRRRRTRHESGALGGGSYPGAANGQHRSGCRLRQRCCLHRKIPSKSRATSNSRFLATARGKASISVNATVRCSAAIRRSGKRQIHRP